jgi:hypothetical protein
MQSKKRIHLQQFGIIHLPNPDLTYIKNPERNKIMYVPFHLLKNLHQESFSILYFFFTVPPREKQRWQPRSARIYARGEVSSAKFLFFLLSSFAKLLEANFSCFAKIIWMPSWFPKLLELLQKQNYARRVISSEQHPRSQPIICLKIQSSRHHRCYGASRASHR